MQVMGVAGRGGSGKTTLIKTLAEAIVHSSYGVPRVLDFFQGGTIDENIAKMQEQLVQAFEDDKKYTDAPRGELLVLVDNVTYPAEVELLRKWRATIIFLDADRRIQPHLDTWRCSAEQLADAYSRGDLPETFFDWHFTNFHELDKFQLEINMIKDYWLGGRIENG